MQNYTWQSRKSWTTENIDIAKRPKKEGPEALQTSKMDVRKEAERIVYKITSIVLLRSNWRSELSRAQPKEFQHPLNLDFLCP